MLQEGNRKGSRRKRVIVVRNPGNGRMNVGTGKRLDIGTGQRNFEVKTERLIENSKCRRGGVGGCECDRLYIIMSVLPRRCGWVGGKVSGETEQDWTGSGTGLAGILNRQDPPPSTTYTSTVGIDCIDRMYCTSNATRPDNKSNKRW